MGLDQVPTYRFCGWEDDAVTVIHREASSGQDSLHGSRLRGHFCEDPVLHWNVWIVTGQDPREIIYLDKL